MTKIPYTESAVICPIMSSEYKGWCKHHSCVSSMLYGWKLFLEPNTQNGKERLFTLKLLFQQVPEKWSVFQMCCPFNKITYRDCWGYLYYLPVVQSLQTEVHTGQNDIGPGGIDVSRSTVVYILRQAAHVLKLQACLCQQAGYSETVKSAQWGLRFRFENIAAHCL